MYIFFQRINYIYLKTFILRPKIISTFIFIPFLYFLGFVLASPLIFLGINKENISLSVSKNPILVTALNREIGYEKAALIAKKAYKENRSVIEVAHEITGIQIKKLKSILNPANLTKGGLK